MSSNDTITTHNHPRGAIEAQTPQKGFPNVLLLPVVKQIAAVYRFHRTGAGCCVVQVLAVASHSTQVLLHCGKHICDSSMCAGAAAACPLLLVRCPLLVQSARLPGNRAASLPAQPSRFPTSIHSFSWCSQAHVYCERSLMRGVCPQVPGCCGSIIVQVRRLSSSYAGVCFPQPFVIIPMAWFARCECVRKVIVSALHKAVSGFSVCERKRLFWP